MLGDCGLHYYHRPCGAFRHLYVYHASPSETDAALLATLRGLRQNGALGAMVERVDYRWIGASGVLFRTKKDAALFRLFHGDADPGVEAA